MRPLWAVVDRKYGSVITTSETRAIAHKIKNAEKQEYGTDAVIIRYVPSNIVR